MNHLANGGFQSRTFFQRFCQWSSLASRAQKEAGFSIDSRYIRLYWAMLEIRAFFENSREGLKTRFSERWLSIFLLMCLT